MSISRSERLRSIARLVLAIAMVGVGTLHFTSTGFFVRIIPKALPAPTALALISGVFEIALGLGLLIPKLRRWSSYGLVALYVAVFPANINMLVNRAELAPDLPAWSLWARLPFQVVFIVWALWVGRASKPSDRSSTVA